MLFYAMRFAIYAILFEAKRRKNMENSHHANDQLFLELQASKSPPYVWRLGTQVFYAKVSSSATESTPLRQSNNLGSDSSSSNEQNVFEKWVKEDRTSERARKKKNKWAIENGIRHQAEWGFSEPPDFHMKFSSSSKQTKKRERLTG